MDNVYTPEQDYTEDIKPIVLIPPGEVVLGIIESAQIVQPKSEIGWQLALKMRVTEENQWFDKALYLYTTLVGKQVHANKAAWYAVAGSKDEIEAVKLAKSKLAGLLGITEAKLTTDYLEQTTNVRATLQGLFYQFYLSQPKSAIPITNSYISVGDAQDKIYSSLRIDKSNPVKSLQKLEGKEVSIFIGSHNEYPKGKFNQTIAGVKFK